MIENMTPVRGTKDFLPKEMKVREKIRKIILSTYSQYGFEQIKTPILENINLLLSSDGGENLKLIYKILKRGEKLDLNVTNENDLVDAGLRYDLTVPLVRFYSNNNALLLPVFKSIQIDDVFRAERPQKGRSRQFTQCDIDIINDATINAEIEVIYVSAQAMLNLGFKNFTIKINDRRILNEMITKSGFESTSINDVCISIDKLDKVDYEGVKIELSEKGYQDYQISNLLSSLKLVKENGINELYKLGISENVLIDIDNIIKSIRSLSNSDYKIEFDINIIRGQGYYTSTIFEIYADGFTGACGGGGRYDNMIEKFSQKSIPAVGFSLGFERLFLIIDELTILKDEKKSLALIYDDNDSFIDVLKYAKELSISYNVSSIKKRKNFNFQLTNLKLNGYEKYIVFSLKKEETIKE